MTAPDRFAQSDPFSLPPIRPMSGFIHNAFQRRYSTVLDYAFENRTRHVIGAVSGAGKTAGLRRFADRHGVVKHGDGTTAAPALCNVATDDEERTAKALLHRLARPLGRVPPLPIAALEDWLLDQMAVCGTRILGLDDSQDFRFQDLRRLKKLGDRFEFEYDREVGIAYVVASQGASVPLRDLLVEGRNDAYRQIRGRFFQERPWTYVPALSRDEVPEALDGLDQALQRDAPGFALEPASDRIFEWMSLDALFDPFQTERVTMRNLKAVAIAAARRWVAQDGGPITDALVDGSVLAVKTGILEVAEIQVQDEDEDDAAEA